MNRKIERHGFKKKKKQAILFWVTSNRIVVLFLKKKMDPFNLARECKSCTYWMGMHDDKTGTERFSNCHLTGGKGITVIHDVRVKCLTLYRNSRTSFTASAGRFLTCILLLRSMVWLELLVMVVMDQTLDIFRLKGSALWWMSMESALVVVRLLDPLVRSRLRLRLANQLWRLNIIICCDDQWRLVTRWCVSF